MLNSLGTWRGCLHQPVLLPRPQPFDPSFHQGPMSGASRLGSWRVAGSWPVSKPSGASESEPSLSFRTLGAAAGAVRGWPRAEVGNSWSLRRLAGRETECSYTVQ